MPKSRNHIPVDGAFEGHDDAFELGHSGPPPSVEFGLVAGGAEMSISSSLPSKRAAYHFAVGRATSRPRRSDQVGRQVITVPSRRLGNDPCRFYRGFLIEPLRAAAGSSFSSMPPCGICHHSPDPSSLSVSTRRPIHTRPRSLSSMMPTQGRYKAFIFVAESGKLVLFRYALGQVPECG